MSSHRSKFDFCSSLNFQLEVDCMAMQNSHRMSDFTGLKQTFPLKFYFLLSGAKSIPIHCVIEQTSGPVTFESNEGASHTTVELDSYAILPSTTLFSELVRASLVKLGYNSTEAMNAKGIFLTCNNNYVDSIQWLVCKLCYWKVGGLKPVQFISRSKT